MNKSERELLNITSDRGVEEPQEQIYETRVYEPTTTPVHHQAPATMLSRMFNNEACNRYLSTICFILFMIGFLWSVFRTGSVNVQKLQEYADLFFFEPGFKPRCERMTGDQIDKFVNYLLNDTLCTTVGDSWLPYCEKVIPFTADIYTCCEDNHFKNLKIGSMILNKQNVLYLAHALKRAF